MEIFENRDLMLSVVPKNGVIAELGVFRGDFSKKIYELCNPSKLVLIDMWSGNKIYSGDVNGNFPNNVKEFFTGDQLYNTTLDIVHGFNCEVTVLRNKTEVLSNFENNFFDMIYIDADHSYNGVLHDLKLSYEKIKDGGFIMGHDYEQNMSKTKNVYNFGVKRAVDEFCLNYNQKIIYKAIDGCVSFAIKIDKNL